MMGNFYVHLAILEDLSKVDNYDFDEHDVMLCFALKESTNKFFSLMKRSFMKYFAISAIKSTTRSPKHLHHRVKDE